MIRLSRLPFLVLLVLLVHCGGKVQVNSLPRKGWSKPVERVFILGAAGPTGSSYLTSDLQARLARLLSDHRVVTHTWMSNLLDLDDAKKLKTELDAFKPHHILTIAQTSVTHTNGASSAATFDLTLSEPGGDLPAWRARTTVEMSWGSDLGKLSSAILEAMQQDGILTRTTPQP